MLCPYCSEPSTSVYNSRVSHNGLSTWRRRNCHKCHSTFTTNEHIDMDKLFNVKSENTVRPYSSCRLLLSIARALDHRENVSEAADYIKRTVEEKLITAAINNGSVILAEDIATKVYETLKPYDLTSLIKYASYHNKARNTPEIRHLLED